jgi:hypothetical protein
MFLNLALNNLPYVASLVASIGVSDAIEFLISPEVHRQHNAPDIMQIYDFSKYHVGHAFMSGIICSVPFGLLVFLPFIRHVGVVVACTNVMIPIIVKIFGVDKRDIFFGHKILYAVNFLGLGSAVVLRCVAIATGK